MSDQGPKRRYLVTIRRTSDGVERSHLSDWTVDSDDPAAIQHVVDDLRVQYAGDADRSYYFAVWGDEVPPNVVEEAGGLFEIRIADAITGNVLFSEFGRQAAKGPRRKFYSIANLTVRASLDAAKITEEAEEIARELAADREERGSDADP